MVANILSLKVIHFAIVIRNLHICLCVSIFIMPLESLFFHLNALSLFTFKLSKFNLNLSLFGRIQLIYYSIFREILCDTSNSRVPLITHQPVDFE